MDGWIRWHIPAIGQVGQMRAREIGDTLDAWRKAALEKLAMTGARHVVYAAKRYGDDGRIRDLELCCEPMDDDRLDLTSKQYDMVCAVHARN